MNRIDRYIAAIFWSFFAGGLLVFVTLFTSIDALSTMVNYKNVAFGSVASYYLAYVPEIAYRMIPVSCLLATLFTLATLQKSNELVALFSIGMGLIRVSVPIIISILLIVTLEFFLSDQFLPKLAQTKNFIFYTEIKKNPSLYSTVKTNRIWYRSKDTIFNIKTLNEQEHKAQGLTMYYLNENWDLLQMVTAKEIKMNKNQWTLFEGSVTLFTEESSFPLTSPFKEKTIVMSEDANDLSSTAHPSDVLSVKELQQFIKKNKEAGLDTIRYEVDYHAKFGFAFSALVMSLLGIPFALSRGRSGGIMVNIGVCLGLVFVYWIMYSSSLTLGQHGQIPPILAAWSPNLILGGFATYMIQRRRE